MPIDADAYMAGAIPTLSRGGSWGVPADSTSSLHPKSTTTPGAANPQSPLSQGSMYSGMPTQALAGFYQNPLMLGRMAAFGSANPPSSPGSKGTLPPARPTTSRKFSQPAGRGLSVVTADHGSQGGSQLGSPLRHSGWSGASGVGRGVEPVSPDREGLTRQRRDRFSSSDSMGVRGGLERARQHKWEEGSWESEARAPIARGQGPGYSYASARPPGPMSLPLATVQKEEVEGRGHRSQSKMRRPERLQGQGEGISPSSARFRPSPLSGISPQIMEESEGCHQPPENLSSPRRTARFATHLIVNRRHNDQSLHPPAPVLLRPALSRRSSEEFKPASPPSSYLRPRLNRRHTEKVETPPPPAPAPAPRVRLPSSPQPVFDMRNLNDALGDSHRSRKHVSPSGDEGYDRYVAHPAVESPTTLDRSFGQYPQDVSITLGSGNGGQREEYLPMGYPRPVREIGWNRDGPAMKTYGIAWLREAGNLASAPEGPRWVQARPPRATTMEGGAWWESGGE